jgi:hypothetical protein
MYAPLELASGLESQRYTHRSTYTFSVVLILKER